MSRVAHHEHHAGGPGRLYRRGGQTDAGHRPAAVLRRIGQERYADPHFRQDPGILLVEPDPHQHRPLAAIRGGNHGDDVRRNLPVRIGIELGRGRLVRLHAIDEVFIDVDLDLERIHVDDGADPGAREAAAGGDGRNDLAGLRRLDGDHTGEGRAYHGVIEIAVGHVHTTLRHFDIAALGGELRPQRIERGFCIVDGRLTDEMAR